MNDLDEKKKDRKAILLDFSNNITLFTIGVLSLAYFNQLIYYSFFSIPIYNYIQVGELVTLFVPSLLGYIFQGLLPIVILYSLQRIVSDIEKDNNINSSGDDSLEIISTLNSIKRIKNLYSINSLKASNLFQTFKNFIYAIKHTIFIIVNSIYKITIILVFVAILFFIFTIFDDDEVLYSQDHSRELFNGAGVQAALCSVAVLMFLEYLNFYLFNVPKKTFKSFSRYALFAISPVFFVIIINSVMTSNIKKGLAEYDVEFKYDGNKIRTDTNIVYVGATQNYLFLRERMTRKNYIYKIDKIDNLSMRKILYKLVWMKFNK